MKKKWDLSFIVFLVIIIVGGIYLNKLTIQKNKLILENENLVRFVENQHAFTKGLQNLYFQGILPRKEKVASREKLCLSWVISASDSVEYKMFSKVMNILNELPPDKVCLYLSADPSGHLKSVLSASDREIIICPDIADKAIFYVSAAGVINGYFEITPYSLPLLERYMKLIREYYLYP